MPGDTCPRCLRDQAPVASPSRTHKDRVLICSACDLDQAVRARFGTLGAEREMIGRGQRLSNVVCAPCAMGGSVVFLPCQDALFHRDAWVCMACYCRERKRPFRQPQPAGGRPPLAPKPPRPPQPQGRRPPDAGDAVPQMVLPPFLGASLADAAP